MVVTLTRDSSLEFDNDKIISHKQVIAKIMNCKTTYISMLMHILSCNSWNIGISHTV